MEIRFVLRLNLREKSKPATIYCRITLEGQRAGDFSTFEHVMPGHWHASGQVVTAGTPEAILTNEALSNTRNALREILNRLVREGTPPSARRIKAEYLRKDIPARTLLDLLQLLLERKTLLKRAKGTPGCQWLQTRQSGGFPEGHRTPQAAAGGVQRTTGR